jgi:hypothetical protein
MFTGSVFRFVPAVNCRRKGCERCGWNPCVAKIRLEKRFHMRSLAVPLPDRDEPSLSTVAKKESNDCNQTN